MPTWLVILLSVGGTLLAVAVVYACLFIYMFTRSD